MSKTNKALRVRFGLAGKPINGTRLLANASDHDFGGKQLESLLIIDDEEGIITSANVYFKEKADMGVGANYDPGQMRQPLPAEGDAKWKKWAKKGYKEVNIDDYPVVAKIGSATVKPAVATATSK